MKPLLLLSLFVPVMLTASPHPEARVIVGSELGAHSGGISIKIYDDAGKILNGMPINRHQSAAADPAGAFVTITTTDKDGAETTLPTPSSVTTPDANNDGWVKVVSIFLPVELDADTTYKVQLRPNGGTPALTYRVDDVETRITDPLVLNAGKPSKNDIEFLEKSATLEPSFEIGGGEEGALLALHWSAGGNTAKHGDYARWFANIDANVSPNEDASDSLITGRIVGDLEGLWRIIDTRNGQNDVTTFLGVSANFESSQDFANWDANVGVASWWYLQIKAVEKLGDVLRISSDEYPVHPIALKIAADYVYASEREEGKQDPEDIQLSARLLWLNRIYTEATLPFMKSQFDVNLLVDVGATWEPGSGGVHPETRLSLEFAPEKFKDANLSFALTWAKGQFSPTFTDEDAFLAGLKLRFK